MTSPEAVTIISLLAAAFVGGYTFALWRVDRWLDSNNTTRAGGFREDRW